MSSIDPAQMAQTLATYDVQPFQQTYQTQSAKYQSQLTALGSVETALKDFRSAISEINSSTSSVIQNTATSSVAGYFTATADSQALAGSYQVFVEQIATAHQVSAAMPANLTTTTAIPATGTMQLTVGSETMTLDLSTIDSDGDGTTTMTELVSAINNSADNPGVNATLVRSNGQTHFMLSSTESGVANSLSVSASGTGESWFEDAFANLNTITAAQDAVIWLGAQGSGLKLTNDSNTFDSVIDGVNLTVTKAQSSGESPLTLEVGPDSEGTKTQVNKLIDAYNSLISTIDQYAQVGGADKDRGVLANDPTLRSIKNQVNNIVREQFDGKILNDIGISIDRNGVMSLDTTKFEAAQKNNSSSLESMFNGTGNLLDSLDSVLDPYLTSSNSLFQSRKDSLQQNIDRISDKLASLDTKYDTAYQRYLKQYTQMNTLVAKMQQTMTMFATPSATSS